MPNWKKLVVSGSSAALSNLNVTNAVTASYFKGDGGKVTFLYNNQSEFPSAVDYHGAIAHSHADGAMYFAHAGNWIKLHTHTSNYSGSFTGDGSALTNIPTADGFPYTGSAIISGALEVTGSVKVSGSVTAHSYTVQNGTGTPTLTSGNSIILSGSEALILKDLALRLESFTNAETSSLTSQDGDIIYNSDRKKILFYTGSDWKHVLVQGDAANLPSGVISSSAQIDNLFNIDGIVSSSAQISSLGFISQSSSGFPFTGSAIISGALNVIGPITASSYKGDGSALTGLTFAQSVTVKSTFTSSLSTNVYHGFSTRNILVSVYDFNYDQVIPARVRLTDDNNINVEFASLTSGHIVVAKGGHIVSGTQPVSELATFSDSFSGVTSYSASHNFNSKNVVVQVYDENDFVIIPNSIELADNNTAIVKFTSPKSGQVVIGKGGHIVSSSVDNSANLGGLPGTYYRNYTNLTNVPSGIVSSSNALYNISGSLLPTITEVFDLGSSTKRWKDLYLSGSTIFLGNTQLSSTQGQNLELRDHTNQRTNLVLDELHIGQLGSTSIILREHNGGLMIHHSGSSNMLPVPTASFALTASYAENAGAGSGFPFSGSAVITGSLTITEGGFIGDGSGLTGISATIAETATLVDNFTNVTFKTSTHNFNTKNVLVQVYNNNDEVIIPSTISTPTVNTVRVTFPETVSGRVVVAKGGHIVSGSGGGGGGGGSADILMHPQSITTDVTVPDYYNAHFIGPVGLNCTVSVGFDSVLSIIEN